MTDHLAASLKSSAAVERLAARIAKGDSSPAVLKALVVDAATTTKNLKALAAEQDVITPDPADPRFVEGASTDTGVYVLAFPGEIAWTSADAVRWFLHVWANNVGYHAVKSGLLPGSHVLTPEGLTFAQEFEAKAGLVEAPADFNPLGLPLKP